MCMRILKYLSFSLLLSPLMLSCSSPVSGTQGSLQMNLQWPQQFQLLAIPENTDYIELEVRGNTGREVQTRLRRTGSQSRVQYTLNPGMKTLIAKAFDSAGILLAEGQTRAEVKVGLSTQAQLEMVPRPEPSPSSSASTQTGSQTNTGGNSPNLPPSPGTSDRPPEPQPDPNPSTDPVPDSSPSPQASPTSSSGGGGGGNSRPVITSFTQDTTLLAGFGGAIHLLAEANDSDDSLTTPNYSWSCQEVDATDQPFDPIQPCPGPQSGFNSLIGPEVYWMGPGTADVTPVNVSAYKYYRLTLTVSDGSLSASQSVKITVPVGTVGSVSVNPGGFNEQ